MAARDRVGAIFERMIFWLDLLESSLDGKESSLDPKESSLDQENAKNA
jgi:hypothetical protein